MIGMMKNDSLDLKEAITLALANLSSGNANNSMWVDTFWFNDCNWMINQQSVNEFIKQSVNEFIKQLIILSFKQSTNQSTYQAISVSIIQLITQRFETLTNQWPMNHWIIQSIINHFLHFREIVDKGGLDALIKVLTETKSTVQANAAVCLMNLAFDGKRMEERYFWPF